jgi:ribosome-associated translation inhibitor RaiA
MMDLENNVTLIGFKELNPEQIETAKKIALDHAKKFSQLIEGFEKLSIKLKPIHQHNGKGGKFELDAKVIVKGKPLVSEVVDHDLFVGLDSVISKVYSETERISEKQRSIDKRK